VTPSVGGRERFVVGSLLALSSAVTGALTGFAAGVVWTVATLPELGRGAAAAVVVAAAAADLLGIRPPSSGRQVPREWSRVFPLRTVAVLYGSRLGVAPLTILNTWMWWAALVVGASLGPWTSVLVGLTFGSTRGVLTGTWHRLRPRSRRR
jgi:hypothetical protein